MRTLIIIKPWAVSRGLVGEILSRFERRGIRLAGLKVVKVDRERAEKLYAVHKGKEFYESLIKHITSSPVVVGVLDIGIDDPEGAIRLVRKIIGATDPAKAEMGTIRGDFGLRIDRNVIHASDSTKSAKYEIPIFFDEDELVEY
ncbi:MAG: nucleoside-diphosphate kinase [Candidatus Altiarchaeales archaeon]|nr:MAG: nucleoside-diphosphate kinase [Candidatus Altiarchaeales archaeon]